MTPQENSTFICRNIVDSKKYPIHKLTAPSRDHLVIKVQEQLAEDGCAVIPKFISDQGLSILLKEVKALKHRTYYSPNQQCNVYLNQGDPEKPEDHPQNIFLTRNNGFITADWFNENTAARQLYMWQPLRAFLAQCLGKQALYIYHDTVSNMIVNVAKPGQQFNWHFDTNEFTITVLLQKAESGGCFEYVPNLRTSADECYNDVKQVLQGNYSQVRQLKLEAGDLQLFLGRFSLHRVTENTGHSERLLLIMSFSERAGMVGSIYRVRDLYGKVTPQHRLGKQQPIRADRLLD